MMTFLAIILAWMYTKLTTVIVVSTILAIVLAVTWFVHLANSSMSNFDDADRRRQKLSFKWFIFFALIAFLTPGKESLKFIAATGGIVWAVGDEDVQAAVKTVTAEAGNIASAMLNQAVSAAKGSGDTLGLVNELIQVKIKQEIKGTISQ